MASDTPSEWMPWAQAKNKPVDLAVRDLSPRPQYQGPDGAPSFGSELLGLVRSKKRLTAQLVMAAPA